MKVSVTVLLKEVKNNFFGTAAVVMLKLCVTLRKVVFCLHATSVSCLQQILIEIIFSCL